jgi:hypothetical protein
MDARASREGEEVELVTEEEGGGEHLQVMRAKKHGRGGHSGTRRANGGAS